MIGSIDGVLWVLNPNNENNTLNCLVELITDMAVIDIKIANFIAGIDQNLIAVLFPYKLITYRLISGKSY